MIVLQQLTERSIPQGPWQASPQGLPCSRIIAQPQVTPDDMFEQPHRLTLHNLTDHVTQHRPHRIKPLVGLADVRQSHIIQQDLLNDEDGYGLTEFRASLHDPEAERDDFGGEKESDYVGIIVLFYQSTDDTEGCETEVFERTSFAGGVEERVEEEWDVCL